MPPNQTYQAPSKASAPHSASHSGEPKLVDSSVQKSFGLPVSKLPSGTPLQVGAVPPLPPEPPSAVVLVVVVGPVVVDVKMLVVVVVPPVPPPPPVSDSSEHPSQQVTS